MTRQPRRNRVTKVTLREAWTRPARTHAQAILRAEPSCVVAPAWPADFVALAGGCPDFPDLAEIRSTCGTDAPRDTLEA